MSPFLISAALMALYPAAATTDASVEESLAAKFPGVEAEHVRPSQLPGLWEVAIGPQVVYFTADGRYMVRGELVDMMTGQNLTEARQSELRLSMVNDLDPARMIVFAAEKSRHTITVLTDIDCGYCRRLHREIGEYNARGISVQYMFMPLAGPGSPSWAKADAVWCSKDRKDALTRAKLGDDVKASGACVNSPVAEHYALAGELGVTGTPAILTDTGELLRGYVQPEQLATWLDQQR
jgi:thiol:disulfide interchange protein DsbC